MNIWDVVITFAIAAVLFLAIRAVGKRKKSGNGCGCGCAECSSSCPMASAAKSADGKDKED
jgi:hypothetical protein